MGADTGRANGLDEIPHPYEGREVGRVNKSPSKKTTKKTPKAAPKKGR